MFFKICNKYKLASSGFLNKVLDFLPDGSKHSSESRHFLSSSHSLQLHPHVRHVSINIVLHKKVSIIEKRDASALRDTVYRVHFKSGQNLSLLMLQDFLGSASKLQVKPYHVIMVQSFDVYSIL